MSHHDLTAQMMEEVGIINLPNLEWFIDTDNSFTDAGSTPTVNDGDLIYQHTDLSDSAVDLIQATGTSSKITTVRPIINFFILPPWLSTREERESHLLVAAS